MNKDKILTKREFLHFVKSNICKMCVNYPTWNTQLEEVEKIMLLECLEILYNCSCDAFYRLHDMATAIDNEKILFEIERRFEKLNKNFAQTSVKMKNILKLVKENKDEL